MRESFGGAFMINLLIFFIVVYVSLMCIAIVYSRAFRVKNEVINIIEQYQYAGETNSKAEQEIEKYLLEIGYPTNTDDISEKCAAEDGKLMNGVCIVTQSYNASARYYKVITYIHIDLPLFDLDLILPISGETKVIR